MGHALAATGQPHAPSSRHTVFSVSTVGNQARSHPPPSARHLPPREARARARPVADSTQVSGERAIASHLWHRMPARVPRQNTASLAPQLLRAAAQPQPAAGRLAGGWSEASLHPLGASSPVTRRVAELVLRPTCRARRARWCRSGSSGTCGHHTTCLMLCSRPPRGLACVMAVGGGLWGWGAVEGRRCAANSVRGMGGCRVRTRARRWMQPQQLGGPTPTSKPGSRLVPRTAALRRAACTCRLAAPPQGACPPRPFFSPTWQAAPALCQCPLQQRRGAHLSQAYPLAATAAARAGRPPRCTGKASATSTVCPPCAG